MGYVIRYGGGAQLGGLGGADPSGLPPIGARQGLGGAPGAMGGGEKSPPRGSLHGVKVANFVCGWDWL